MAPVGEAAGERDLRETVTAAKPAFRGGLKVFNGVDFEQDARRALRRTRL